MTITTEQLQAVLTQIREAFDAGASLVTVTGPQGSGKSRVAAGYYANTITAGYPVAAVLDDVSAGDLTKLRGCLARGRRVLATSCTPLGLAHERVVELAGDAGATT